MCLACQSVFDRRRFLAVSAASIAGAAFCRGGLARAAIGADVTADQALAKLKAGNDKFVDAPQLCAADPMQQRRQVAEAQTPWATIVACSDSRVPPELLFGGLGIGDLFVARNAGNMVDTATMGTIEYGAGHLGVPLVVVLGHQRCGAVEAACAVVEKHEKFPGSIGPMVEAIVPAARAVHGRPGNFVENAIRESAKRTAANVASKSQIVAQLVKTGKVKVVAARYDLDSGRVEFLT